jgi:hypothetical protein
MKTNILILSAICLRKSLLLVFSVLFISSILYPSGIVKAQSADSSLKSFRLFEDESLMNVSLRFDLSTYFRSKPQKEYLKANITFHISESDSVTSDIRLRTRGVFRNQYCMFAPIQLNFKKAGFGYSDLKGISKLKMVPQCSSGKDKEDYILREYLAYKLFNVLTDTSFRVRLISVDYIDSQKKRKSVKQFAFFIEPVEMLTARTNSIELTSKTATQRNVVPRIMDRLSIFNYMIGNYDWSVPGQHNVQLIKSLNLDPYGFAIAVPYDFDWTGLVNASYAIPAENVGTQNVRERVFTGICRKKEIYTKELDMFLSKKDEFYKVINEFPYITQKVKKDMISYLNTFFDQLDGKKDLILNKMMSSCKNL